MPDVRATRREYECTQQRCTSELERPVRNEGRAAGGRDACADSAVRTGRRGQLGALRCSRHRKRVPL
eukprot:6176083-Pleurochrysis_carterae.AAC.2